MLVYQRVSFQFMEMFSIQFMEGLHQDFSPMYVEQLEFHREIPVSCREGHFFQERGDLGPLPVLGGCRMRRLRVASFQQRCHIYILYIIIISYYRCLLLLLLLLLLYICYIYIISYTHIRDHVHMGLSWKGGTPIARWLLMKHSENNMDD